MSGSLVPRVAPSRQYVCQTSAHRTPSHLSCVTTALSCSHNTHGIMVCYTGMTLEHAHIIHMWDGRNKRCYKNPYKYIFFLVALCPLYSAQILVSEPRDMLNTAPKSQDHPTSLISGPARCSPGLQRSNSWAQWKGIWVRMSDQPWAWPIQCQRWNHGRGSAELLVRSDQDMARFFENMPR